MGFPAVAGKTPHKVRALLSIGAVACNKAGNRSVVERGDEDLDVGGMMGVVFRRKIEKDGLEGFWDLGMGEHRLHFIDGAEANFEIGILFGG